MLQNLFCKIRVGLYFLFLLTIVLTIALAAGWYFFHEILEYGFGFIAR